jgi:phage terminase small subunit
MALTPKQQRFVEEYLVDLNATQAAIRAGYAESGARTEGTRLLADANIAEAVSALKAERSERTRIDADWLLRRLADEAEADMSELYDEHGGLLPVKDWPLIWRKGLVAGLDVEEIREEGAVVGIIRKVKLSDRIKRLELIGKHIDVQAFKDKVEHSGAVSLTVLPEDAAL